MKRLKKIRVQENSLTPENAGSVLMDFPHPILRADEALWLRSNYIYIARDYVKTILHNNRVEMENHPPYIKNHVIGYKFRGIVCKAACNHVQDDTKYISRICIMLPQVYDKDDNKWYTIDSHIWLRLSDLMKPTVSHLSIRLGDMLTFWGAKQRYVDKIDKTRNGISWWQPEKSILMYSMMHLGHTQIKQAPHADKWLHDLIAVDPTAESGWHIADEESYDKDYKLLTSFGDNITLFCEPK